MEYLNDVLCISYRELTDGVMTPGSLKWHLRSGSVRRVRRGGNGREALFAVESLPPRFRDEVYRRNPGLDREARLKPAADAICLDGAAHVWYTEFRFDNGAGLPAERIEEYTANASVLNVFRDLLRNAEAQRRRHGARPLAVAEFWADKAALLPLLARRLPHTLPSHPRRLQSRYEAYVREGYIALVSKKFRNRNASKVSTPEQESTMIRLLGDHRNLDNSQVAKLYDFIASRLGWPQVTARAVGSLRRKYDLVTAPARRGASEFYNSRAMQVRRTRPTSPMLYWTADGWDVELYYRSASADGRGRVSTTYANRLTMVVVLDPCGDYPVGYAVGTHETPELIRAALRDAVNHVRTLCGERLRVWQFQSDHYALKTLSPLYAAVADKVTPARVRNAKAKVVEPYFRYLNKTYFQYAPNWSGFGVTSRPDSQPNADKLNAVRRSFPDREGCAAQIEAFMEAERASKREAYAAALAALPPERRLPLSDEAYLLHFGMRTGRRNALDGAGLLPTIEGVKVAYDCFDARMRSYPHVRWTILYDPDDMDRALAVNDDATLRFMLERKHLQPMALADRRPGDADELARVQRFNRELEARVVERFAEADRTARRLVLENPALRNSYAKALICDSDGSHKNARNRRRRELEAAPPPDDAPVYDFY